ncbi:Mitochondrial outer membrane protein iml2 [Marasmius crinis-equi]|uniref:Mitochondrial outer membrane protein iml2 n=1 Tax=Marasmius crinis-equi TaxID=585013 RepID=A0ABR3G1V4_9AGAR
MSTNDSVQQLQTSSKGFDHMFNNDVVQAKAAFAADDSPFHLVGMAACVFLEAALGMETAQMAEASKLLTQAEAASRKGSGKPRPGPSRFPEGLEMEILNADAVILLGITHALSESYMGYLQCMYSLNSAHSKFTKLYKTVFPSGLEGYSTPAASPGPSRVPSQADLHQAVSAIKPSLKPKTSTTSLTLPPTPKKATSFFGRWTSSGTSTPNTLAVPTELPPDGPIEDLIVCGTAFGYGLFNLVFSLLPKKIQSVVGIFGFKHDRALALEALAVSAARKDTHSVFAGLVLMTYRGVVLLLSGYQADETHILRQYTAIVDSMKQRYPNGSLWILNEAKIKRMRGDAEGAIKVLEDGLEASKKAEGTNFRQADSMLVFELAWTYLSRRQYREAAEMFMRMTTLNNWSHTTYYFLAAGCYFSVGDKDKAQELIDQVPSLSEKKGQGKVGGKPPPTEVWILKKLEFYKQKAQAQGAERTVDVMKISPTEEISIFWNTHARITPEVAKDYIAEWSALTPPVAIQSQYITTEPSSSPSEKVDLTTPDELAIRSLLLGLVHRTLGDFDTARKFLDDAVEGHNKVDISTWIGGVAMFERAVVDLQEMEIIERSSTAPEPSELRTRWLQVLKETSEKLDKALSLAPNSVDLSSRLDSRVAMLRDEIEIKRGMLAQVKA